MIIEIGNVSFKLSRIQTLAVGPDKISESGTIELGNKVGDPYSLRAENFQIKMVEV